MQMFVPVSVAIPLDGWFRVTFDLAPKADLSSVD